MKEERKKKCIFFHDWDETYTEKVKGHNAHTRTCKWCGKKQANVDVGWRYKWIDFDIFLENYVCVHGSPGVLRHM